MIDIIKHLEFFDPTKVNDGIHIIGCGAIGSNIAETLTRLGFENLHLYDFDTVSTHNIANQCFFADQIGKEKVEALAETLCRINNEAKPIMHKKGWNPNISLSGYVFLCPDSIKVRQDVVKSCIGKQYVKGIFDFRMRLSDAQHYAAEYDEEYKNFTNLLKSMDFTEEEAKEATPVSACGTTLSVITTIRTITAAGIANFINLIKNPKAFKHIILIDSFKHEIDPM